MNTKISSESSSFFPEPSARSADRRKAAPGAWARFIYGLGWLLLVLWFVGGGLFVALRVWVLPWVGAHPEWVAAQLSRAIGLPVKIDRLETGWPGLRPRLRLGGLAVHDEAGREVLRLEQVEATLAWSSLWRRMPDFHWLEIIGPTIELGRGKDGVPSVAGIHLASGESNRGRETGAGFVTWLLGQHRVAVRDATLIWNDELRAAPPLRLEEARFVFSRGRGRHRFALKARPPARMATMLDVRGELGEFFDPGALATASGRLYVGLERADLGSWRAWVDYPFPCRGHGGVRLWLDSDGAGGIDASADVQLDGVEATLAPELPPLRLTRLSGNLRLHRATGKTEMSARELWLVMGNGGKLAPTDFTLRLHQTDDGAVSGGEFSASAFDLAVLAHLAGRLPLSDESMRAALAALDLRGRVRALSFGWRGRIAAPHAWTLKTYFEDAGFAALGAIPGAGGLSGRIEGNEQTGNFTIASRDAHLDLPAVFEEARIFFAALDVDGGWKRQNGRLELMFEAVKFANDDAEGAASGRYWRTNGEPGEVDFTAKLARADGAAVWRYLPRAVNERVHEWVQGAIQHGKVSGVSMELRGRLKDFPFREKQGRFFVKADVTGGQIEYAAGWPALEDIAGELRFEGPGLSIEASKARIFETHLERIRLGIPDLGAGVMAVEGTANGPSADFLRFIAESPLPARLRDFTAPLWAEGNGQLDLNLVIPLRELEATTVSGDYHFAANRIGFAEGWPTLENAGGNLSFTGDRLRIPSIRAHMLGAPVAVEGSTTAAGLSLHARGQADMASARKTFPWPLLERLDGIVDWQAELAFGHDNAWAIMHLGLDDLRSRLPAPFAKERGEKWPLEIVAISSGEGKSQRLVAKLGKWLDVELERDAAGALRGGVSVNQPARQDGTGIQVAAAFDTLDIDAWRRILDEKRGGGDEAPPLAGVTLEAGQLRAFGRTFNAVKLRALADAEGWKAKLESAEAQGDLIWRKAGDGMLSARLRRLALPGEEARNESENEMPPPQSLPGLDIRAEQFALGGSELGRLEVRALNQDGHWRLDKFSVHHPDAQFSGSGVWQPGEQGRTQVDFTLSTSNIGHLAKTLGYANIVRGGQATLSGQLSWQDMPLRIDYRTLSGQLDLNARNGRFEQLEPGVGRLFGVLSLQALPRRATLDFRDVFSEGFIFDRIAGNIAVANGVMRTDKIEIAGPAARVFMSGQADVAEETQDLRVTVRPTLAESVAVGAAVVNPAAGAVTYLAQKALGDPIEKMFSYDYTITGNWSDPLVEKVVTVQPAKQTSVGDEGLLQGLP
ncbi:MAG: TIGR02099 family protein [Azoarcus sp.]|nr:TIGR02099 family protein [Azoarcus sp.]